MAMEILNDNFAKPTRDLFAGATLDASLDPNSTNPLLDGEWVVLSGGPNTVERAGDNPAMAYPVWTERGRTDTQALPRLTTASGGKVSVLEDFTGLRVRVTPESYDSASFATYTLNTALTVESLIIDGGADEQSVLVPAATGEPIYGFVVGAPASATDNLYALLTRAGYLP